MNNRRLFGISNKVFLYTMLIFLLVIGGLFLFFSNQIQSTIALTQQRQFSASLVSFVEQTQGKETEEIIKLTEDFHRWNSSFEIRLIREDGVILFQTDGFAGQNGVNQVSYGADGAAEVPSGTFGESLEIISGEPNALYVQRYLGVQQTAFLPLGNGLHVQISGSISEESIYIEILKGATWIFALIILICLFTMFFFSRLISKPIQKVSSDTHKMSLLLPVDPPKKRGDEIGQLSKDVYAMYSRLKSTIGQLETEINRVKMMEENQRYFFSAASHELKTPITAVGGIFEGMLSDVITQEEYPAYLREGIKLVGEQSKLVSEILELVKLGGELPSLEKEPINLRRCLDSLLEPLTPLIESKRQLVTVDVADNIICELNDRLLSKALSNVLLNAAQNSPDGAEIRVTAEVTTGVNTGVAAEATAGVNVEATTEVNTECIRLSIWNSDAEIPEKVLSSIYEPFYRADEARTSGEGRSGLGLAIVKKALDLMGIAFEVKNTNGGVLFMMEIVNE